MLSLNKSVQEVVTINTNKNLSKKILWLLFLTIMVAMISLPINKTMAKYIISTNVDNINLSITVQEVDTFDLLPPFELPDNLITGESFKISEMPDFNSITENAITNTPENTEFYGWLIESEFAQVLFDNLDEAKMILEDTYSYEEEFTLRLTPIYKLLIEFF